jgi:type I restriction enzyme S subunit
MYGATIGKLGVLKQPAATNQACAALLSEGLTETEKLIPFAFYYLLLSREDLRKIGQGGAQPNISQTILKEYACPLPPLNEQRRIVEKIEALTARSRKARAALDDIPALLDQFRQSVLAAAFRGDLTADWRTQNPDVEPAKALLERIRVERRKQWEESEREKMEAKGRLPKDNKWREKYKNPIAPQLESLRQLPETWAWATLDQVMKKIVDGTHHTPTYTETGIPFLSVKDIREGRLYFDNCKYISEKEHACLIERCHPQENDLLITKSGTIGRCAVIRAETPFSLFVSVALLKPVSVEILTDFISVIFQAWLQTINVQNYVTGSAIKNFHIIDFRKLPLPIPPIEEQKQIIRQVQVFQACIENIKLQNQEIEATVDNLDRSILAKAFRGELVPQDPTDEPAAVLLERIRAEREQMAGAKQKRVKGKG